MGKIKYSKTDDGRRSVEVEYRGYYDGVFTINKEIGKIRSKIAKKAELIAKEERAIADAYFEIGRRYKNIEMLRKLSEDTSAIPVLKELEEGLRRGKEEKEKQATK